MHAHDKLGPEFPKPSGRRRFLTLLAAGVVCHWNARWLQADERTLVRKGMRRVQPLCSVPPANYQHGARSISETVLSQAALPIIRLDNLEGLFASIRSQADGQALPREPVVGLGLDQRQQLSSAISQEISPKAKVMQLAQRAIVIHHCEISDLALMIEPDGTWQFSLRGVQNPVPREGERTRNRELHLKRNAFHVQIRLLRTTQGNTESLVPRALADQVIDRSGKLALAHLEIDEFWVQREAPEYVVRRGNCRMIEYYFDVIDQAEFEFFVRYDALTGSGEGVVPNWQREP